MPPAGIYLGALLSVISFAAAACEGKDKPSPVPARASTAFTEPEKVALMEQHYNAAIAAHDALIRGDEDTLRRRLLDLSSQPLPKNAPLSWKPQHDRMRAAAGGAQSATSDDAAAAAMASVVETCGTCHEQLAQGPLYQKPTVPDGADPLHAEMQRHQWATERLWEGVTGPWSDAWERGAEALTRGAVFPSDGGAIAEELRRKEASLRALGDEARKTTGLRERARLYGKMLATCADCHRQVGVSTKPTARNVVP